MVAFTELRLYFILLIPDRMHKTSTDCVLLSSILTFIDISISPNTYAVEFVQMVQNERRISTVVLHVSERTFVEQTSSDCCQMNNKDKVIETKWLSPAQYIVQKWHKVQGPISSF